MKQVSSSNFGLLIANIVPGFTALWGVSYFSESVRIWLGSSPVNAPTVGGFLYVTIASVAAGLTVSSVRWLLIDTIHRWTGIRQPAWNFSRLQEKITAYRTLVEIHYHYYQFFANMVIALTFVFITKRASQGFFTTPVGWTDVAFLAVGTVYFVTSQDNLRKYYLRVAMLLGTESDSHGTIALRSESNTKNRILNPTLLLRKLKAVPQRQKQENSKENHSTIRTAEKPS